MAEITRGQIIRDDVAWFDGVTRTASRVDATGGTVTGLNFGDEVDVLQVFGSGTSRSVTTINDAVARLGGANATLLFSTGTWTIDSNLTIPTNVTCKIPHGCTFSVDSGKTLTFNGHVNAGIYQIFSGSGSFAGFGKNEGAYTEWWGAVGDNSNDDSAAWRHAVIASRQVNCVPNKTYLVSADGANAWAIRHTDNNGLKIVGNGSTIRSADGVLQLLRNTGTGHFIATDLNFDGPATDGTDLGAGLLQINDANGVSLINVRSTDSDQDGLVVSACTRVHLFGCGSNNDSKSGIYINQSTDVRIIACEVDSFGGHTVSGSTVGTGIQLSGNTNLLCMACTVKDGVGTGIRVNDNNSIHPSENSIIGNIVSGCRNATNVNESFGIRLTNGDATKKCGTVVQANDVFDCGIYGIYVENHHGASIRDNKVVQIDRQGIIIGTLTDCIVANNDVWNCDTDAGGSRFVIETINAADGVVIVGNRFKNSSEYTSGSAALTVKDGGSGTNVVQNLKRVLDDTGTPSVLGGGIFNTGGTTAITDFDDGIVGDTLKILSGHTVTITDNAAIVLNGSANYDMTTTDTLVLEMFDDQVWNEVSRSVN